MKLLKIMNWKLINFKNNNLIIIILIYKIKLHKIMNLNLFNFKNNNLIMV